MAETRPIPPREIPRETPVRDQTPVRPPEAASTAPTEKIVHEGGQTSVDTPRKQDPIRNYSASLHLNPRDLWNKGNQGIG